jgi:hypothetical protein
MKITIESTSQIVHVSRHLTDLTTAVPGRIWEGKTDSGIYVQCVITRIAAPAESDLAQFDRELTECIEPQRTDVFPLRLIL